MRDGVLTRFQADQLLAGKWRNFLIAGKYKLLERLGAGGMGTVFLCEHIQLRRRVAVKVLPPHQAKNPAALERFYREARAAAALDHPNIVHAYDVDQDGNLHFLVMEYVDGASLQEIVKQHRAAGRAPRLPLHRARRRWACSTPTRAAWSTATSSRATCCSTATAPSRCSTSAWPGSSTTRATT